MNSQSLRYAAILAVCAAVLSPSLAFAQRGGGGFRGGGPGGFGGPFGGGGLMGLVMRGEVQQELQLVDEQQEKVNAVTEEMRDTMRDEMRDIFSQMRDLSDEERQARFDEVRARLESLNSDMEKRLKKVLLPHQFDRLKQIDVQTRLQQRGAAALTSGEVAEALDLTEEQREKLEQRAAEVEQELQDQIRQLRVEARNKLLEVLTPEQRAKLESMMGDQFDVPEQSFGGRGGRFGRGFNRGPDGGNDRERGRNRAGERRPAREAI
jgi:Spy/CpxP family protein refolding chaperone